MAHAVTDRVEKSKVAFGRFGGARFGINQGWVSTGCKGGRCSDCFSMKCSCACHRIPPGPKGLARGSEHRKSQGKRGGV